MFSAKQNTAKPTNAALSSQQAKPFFSPEMKVVKSDNKEEVKNKEVKKSNLATPEKTPFIAPKEPAILDKEKDAIEVSEVANKDSVDNKKEVTKHDLKNKSAEKTIGNSKTATATESGAAVANIVAPAAKIAKPLAKATEKIESITTEEVKSEKENVEEIAGAEKAIPKAPTRPEDDPAFQAQITATEKAKEEKSQHPEPTAKVGEQQAAGHASPAAQASKNDQEAHAASMDATSEQEKEREPFTPESFKKLLEKNLDDLEKQLPQNSEEAQEFRDEKPIEGIKENISGQVTAESDTLAGPMKSEADQPAPVTGAPTLEAQPLPVANVGVAPQPLNAKAAIPKPKTSQEISMEKESQSLDDKMAENNVTDEQLAKSNEPKFTGALDQKNQAQVEAKLAPVNYRKKEEAQLGAAQNTATTSSQEGLNQMQDAKALSENDVLANQTTNKTSDKTEQEKIFAEFEAIYETTKKTVTDSLEKLSEDVDKKFSEEAESAQKTFEKNVEDGLGDIYGWTVIDDWIFGEDTEAIDRLFRVEKSKFVAKMNSVLDAISIIIANGLNGALDAIAAGKKKSKEKFDSLDESQKKLGEDAFNDFNDQYAALEDTVYEKQEELASDLAQSYKENVDSLQAKFDEIKESVSAGWIGGALNALAGVIKTILEIKDLLLSLLAGVASAIGAILSDPIGFLSNLISGVKQGFIDFGNNIKKHMIKGLLEWLTGSLGNVGITMPDNLFSLSGIFSLVSQMLGLTWDYFREKAVKYLGEPVVEGIEKAVEIFQIVKKDGVMGLWEYIKEQFGNLKEMVMDAIRDMVITKVIEAGIKWIMGLLSPAGAFVKAAMLIVDIVKFFVERASQIIELVQAFVGGIAALAAGNVKAVSKAIETALAKALPVVISFLAALVGITGLTGKIQKIIKKVRKKIDKAIKKIIFKAKKAFNKILGKRKPKKGDAKKIKDDNKKGKPDKLTAKDKAKHKKVIKKIEKKLGEKAKKGEEFNKFHGRKKKEAKSLEDKYQPQLKKGINLDIKFNSVAKDKEDNDVDIKIKIAPNTATGGVQAPANQDSKVTELFEKNKTKVHKSALKKVENAIKKIDEEDKKAKGNKKVKAWSGVVKKLRNFKTIKQLGKKPFSTKGVFGTHNKNTISVSGNKILSGLSANEKATAITNTIKKIEDPNSNSLALVSLRSMVLENTEQKTAIQRIEKALKGGDKEHNDYKITVSDLKFDGTSSGKLVINYSYKIQQANQKPETRKFSITLDANGKTITHKAKGTNLGIKDPGRGYTKSAENAPSQQALVDANKDSKANPMTTDTQISEIAGLADSNVQTPLTNIEMVSKEQRAGYKASDHYKKQLEVDNADKTKNIKFNASHLIADWFNGSGYSNALNLVHTSEYYNKEVMGKMEKQVVSGLTDAENAAKAVPSSTGKYITFNALVTAKWQEITDNTISGKIKAETDKALKARNKEEKEAILKDLVKDLAKATDPKFCKSVHYLVNGVKLKDANGKVVKNLGYMFNKSIPEDTHLKDILAKLNK